MQGFLGGSVVKHLPAGAGDTSLISWETRSTCVPWSTCLGAAEPVCPHFWGSALEPRSHNYWHHTLQLMKTTCPRAQALQQGKPPRWEACSAQLERSPCSVQLEESLHSHEDPEQPKINKLTNKENQCNNSWWEKY